MFTSDFITNGTSSRFLYLCPYSFLWGIIITFDFVAFHIYVTFYYTLQQKPCHGKELPFYYGFVLPVAL